MRHIGPVLGCVVSALLVALPGAGARDARAQTYSLVATGEISQALTDSAGLFGLQGPALLSMPYTLSISIPAASLPSSFAPSASSLQLFGSGGGTISLTVGTQGLTQQPTPPQSSLFLLSTALGSGGGEVDALTNGRSGGQQLSAGIDVGSNATSFVPSLDFGQTLSFAPKSPTLFNTFGADFGRATFTLGNETFTGSVSLVAMNPVAQIITNQFASPCINLDPANTCAGGGSLVGLASVATGNMTVGTGGGAGTLAVNGGAFGPATLSAANLTLGGTSDGTATIGAGGTLSVAGTLNVGQGGSAGHLELQDQAALNATTINVGGNGTLVLHTSDIGLNFQTLNLGGGQVKANADLVLDYTGQSNSSYTVNHTSGSNTVAGQLVLGAEFGNTGQYNLSGGSLTANGETIGDSGTAFFSHTGGKNTIATDLVIGQSCCTTSGFFSFAGSGSYTLGGTGELKVGGDLVLGGQNGALGFFSYNTQTGDAATLTIGGQLVVGAAGSGSFQQGGGTLDAAILIGALPTGEGEFDLQGGILHAPSITVGGTFGRYQQTGGIATVDGNFIVGTAAGFGATGKLDGTGILDVRGDLIVGADPTAIANRLDVNVGSCRLGVCTPGAATLLVAGNLVVGDASSGTLNLYGGQATVGGMIVGNAAGANGDAFLGSTANLAVTGDLTIGAQAGSTGALFLNTDSGDAASVTVGGKLTVGDTGTGSFTQLAGTLTAGSMVIGNAAGSIGTATVGGTANLTVTGDLTIGAQAGAQGSLLLNTAAGDGASLTVGGNLVVGGAGTGMLTQMGGALRVSGNAIIGDPLAADGRVSLGGTAMTAVDGDVVIGSGVATNGRIDLNLQPGDAATLAVGRDLIVGDAGTGAFNQQGGSATVGRAMIVGNVAGSNGSATLGGGSLAISGDLTLGAQAGAEGTFNYNTSSGNAATLTVGGAMVVGDAGVGTFNQGGGVLQVSSLVIGNQANVTQSGANLSGNGALIVTGDLGIGVAAGANGRLGVADTASISVDGNLTVGVAGAGTVAQTGGSVNVAGTAVLGSLADSSGNYSLSGNGLLAIGNGLTVGDAGTGRFTQTGGTALVHGDTTLANAASGDGRYDLGGTGSLAISGNLILANGAGSLATFNYNVNAGDNAQLAINGGALTVGMAGTADFNHMGGSLAVASLTVGSDDGSIGTYRLGGTGTLAVSNGLGGGDLTIGDKVGSIGLFVYDPANGHAAPLTEALKVGGQLLVGNAGNGEFDHNGGLLRAAVVVGAMTRGVGTYVLGGTGSLDAKGDLVIGRDAGAIGDFRYNNDGLGGATLQVGGRLVVGGGGFGGFEQQGGSLIVPLVVGSDTGGHGIFTLGGSGMLTGIGNLVLGDNAGAIGEFNFNTNAGDAASLAVLGGRLVVGNAGTGTFTHEAGSVVASITLGAAASGQGTYRLNQGSLNATSETIGDAGHGRFVQMGGSNTAGVLTIAAQPGSTGSYELAGGTLTASVLRIGAGGSFNQTGGTAHVSGDATTAGQVTLDGGTVKLAVGGSYTQQAGSTLLFHGATLQAANILVEAGTFGGNGTVIGNLTIHTGVLQVGASPDTLHIAGDFSQTGGEILFEIDPDGKGGFLTSKLVFDPGADLDITGVTVTFDFLGGADPLAFFHDGLFTLASFLGLSDGSSFTPADFARIFHDDQFVIGTSSFAVTGFSFDPAIGALELTEGAAVPEPEAVWLLLPSLALLAWRRRPIAGVVGECVARTRERDRPRRGNGRERLRSSRITHGH